MQAKHVTIQPKDKREIDGIDKLAPNADLERQIATCMYQMAKI